MKNIEGLIANLLARAEHPNTPAPEAELAYAQANKLMMRHAIDEAEIRAGQSASERRRPVVENVPGLWTSSVYSYYMRDILSQICKVNRVRYFDSTLVGFSEDVAWTKQLFLSVQLSLATQMRPKWDPEATVEANIYAFKKAGFKWLQIWEQMAAYDGGDLPCKMPPNDGGWMIRAYKRHAKLVGDDTLVTTQRHEAYRESFVAGYVDRLTDRLVAMRLENEEASKAHGQALELSQTAVDEAFYDAFPDLSPEARRAQREAQRAADEAARKAEQERWDGLTDRQKAKELEAEARRRSADDRWWRANSKRRSARYTDEGVAAGRAAANSVSLARSGAPVPEKAKQKELS